MKYLSEKELMEITTTNETNERFKEITKKYPILKKLEKKLNYEQFANLFFLVDYLYSYQEMWEELKEENQYARLDRKFPNEPIGLEMLMNEFEQKYFPK